MVDRRVVDVPEPCPVTGQPHDVEILDGWAEGSRVRCANECGYDHDDAPF